MSYNSHKLAARLRRIATRPERRATRLVIFGASTGLNTDKHIEKFLDEETTEIFSRVRELRRLADDIQRPLPPIH